MLSLEARVNVQLENTELEKKRNAKRHVLFQAQDDIDNRKEQLLNDLEQRLNQKLEQEELFALKCRIV